MTNKEWMATLTAEQFYDKMMWLVRDFGFRFNNSRLGIIDWLDQLYTPEAEQVVFYKLNKSEEENGSNREKTHSYL